MKNREKKIEEIISYIKSIKEKNGLIITDTHVHPLDVMGVIHYDDYENNKTRSSSAQIESYLKPDILEIFKYGRIATLLSRPYFKYKQGSVQKIIKSIYREATENRLLEEMDSALIDRVVLLPIEPWLTTEKVKKHFANGRFILLGSMDVHNIETEFIKESIKRYKNEYNIVGLKLHPNLQNFRPQPSQNSPEIARKLKIIYQEAENNNLYLLFHGGASHYTKKINPKYDNFIRNKNNAILKNFCDYNGKSELLGQYKVPIIIAHLGHYGIVRPDYLLMYIIAKKYNNVFFDTAGTSPLLLKKTIEIVSSKKIIFGSDALYNKMIYNLIFLYQAAKKVKTEENFENILLNILGINYNTKILRK